MAVASDAWSDAEQELLEEGLVKFAVVCDLKEKWKAIAAHVGTRDVKACAARFKACRERALKEQKEEEEEEEEAAAVEVAADSAWWNGKWSDWRWNGRSWDWTSQSGQGWTDQEWKQDSAVDEADRRKWEIQQEIDANRRRLLQKEEQKQREAEQREAKKRAEFEAKEKERLEKIQEREKKIQEAVQREQLEKAEAERRRQELQRKMEEEDAKAGFYGQRHAVGKGKMGKGRSSGKGTGKGAQQRQQKQEEMERRAREALANIGLAKEPEPGLEEQSEEEEEEEVVEPPAPAPSAPRAAASEAKAPPQAEVDGKGKKGGKSKGKGKGKRGKERKPGWWAKVEGDCPISLVPIAELPAPPFCLQPEGTAIPHYFDARFLASFLLSSFDFINPVNRTALTREECLALDAHLRAHYPEQQATSVADAFDLFQRNGGGGSDSVRREATAVFQHLFRFNVRDLDSRGRAINYNDGGLTVIDDDDIRVSSAQHETYRSGAWAKSSAPAAAEALVTGG
ncbi:unnamed protein product [Symbiodinium sp. CCMP2592]|nr:unnamed protein product [Symbiodinium sp. CCMP2592]